MSQLVFFPGATEADLREVLADTVGICERFRRAGMITATEAKKVARARELSKPQPIKDEVYQFNQGRFTGPVEVKS